MKRARFRDQTGRVLEGTWRDAGASVVGRQYDRDEIDLVAPVTPRKVIGVTPNHVSQFDGFEPPELDIFLKAPDSVVDPDCRVDLPLNEEVIFEAELGVVIGEHCSAVDAAEAETVIEGYTCVNDFTKLGESTLNRQKVFDNATPIGPVVADPEAVPADASIEMWVNGERRQQFSRSDYVHSTSEVIAQVSSLVSLAPGDLVTMGTATGTGVLANGDHTEVEIEGIGTLSTRVRSANSVGDAG